MVEQNTYGQMQEREMTIKDYIRILYRGRWIIAISFIVVAATTAYITFTTQPVYEAAALVLLKQEGGVQAQIFEVSSFIKRETMMNNQVEILKSRKLAEDVIKRLQNGPYADSLWILGSSKEEEKFSIKKLIISFIKRNGDGKEPSAKEKFDEIVTNFRKEVIVTPKRDTDIIELKIDSFSPFEAAYVANAWMYAYQELDISESSGEVSRVRQFLEDKLKDVELELKDSEETLKKYKETESVAELTTETQNLIEQLTAFETQYQSAKTDLEANEQRLVYLKSQLDESQKAILESGTSTPLIEELEKQAAQLIGNLAALEQQLKGEDLYTNNYKSGDLKSLESRLKGIQTKIVEEKKKLVSTGATANPLELSSSLITSILEIETENKSLKVKTDAFRGIVRQFEKNLNLLPEKGLRLAQLQREAQVNNTIFMMLREKYEENRIIEAGQIGSVRVVDEAKPAKDPVKPKKKMNLLLGIMVGLGLGLGITFLREYMDNSLKSIEDVERLGFTVLGSIPFITPQHVSKHVKDPNSELIQIQSRLVTHFAPKAPISEAYRSLRTNIQYAKADKPVQTVLVSSSGPGEGKSTTVANLAITFAQMGTKTLLVDTDLRRPVLHGIFGLSRTDGLTNLLMHKITIEQAILPTKIENLDLLTTGTLPPNPSELLASEAMGNIINVLKKKYQMILFDSPPVIAVTDSAVLSTKMDGVLLVMKSGKTVKETLIRAKILLENVNSSILGIVVNSVQIENMYGSYYYYYYHYYDDRKDKKKINKILT